VPVNAVLISEPSIDFATLLGLTHEALGQNVAEAADVSHRKLCPSEKYLTCLATMADSQSIITPRLLSHVSFGFLVVVDTHELIDILNVAVGMSFVSVPTLMAGCDIIIITGTLAQWRDAIASGTSKATQPTVRACYSKILWIFDQMGLSTVWKDFDRSSDRGGYYLEHTHV
jgi:hypothetical protein